MCCHRLFIYATCGHSTFSTTPLIICRHASIPPNGTHSTLCELIAHPYKSFRFERLCPKCQARRDSMLGRLERVQRVEYDEWKWKVSYALPLHGKDYWTTKMEKVEEDKEREKESQIKDKELKFKRFSWRRKSVKVRSARDG